MYSDKAFFLNFIDAGELQGITANSDANLLAAIEVADNEIDGYLRSRITTLPLQNPPAKIRECSFHMARKTLYSRKSPNNIPDFIVKNYDDAVSYLKNISKGLVQLMPEPSSSVQEDFFYFEGYDSVMSRKG